MRKEFILIASLFLTLTVYSQDYKVQKLKNITKGNYKISRLLVITDSVPNAGVNIFISDFSSALKIEFERHELDFICIRKGTSDVEDGKSIVDKLNPNGILSFIPSQVFLKYTGFTQKKGLFFDLRLSYRYKDVNDFVPLFETKIEVLFDSFENSGELAAKDFFNKMVKEKYLAL